MKVKSRIRAIIVLCSLVGVFFASCSNDDNYYIPNKPVKVEDVQGDYVGKVITIQRDWMHEQNVGFTVGEEVINFANLPIREIVNSITKDAKEASDVLKSIEPVTYELTYTTEVDQTGTVLLLTLAPTELTFKATIEDVEKLIVAQVITPTKGIYVSNRFEMMKFEWTINKITVDGEEEKDFEDIKYFFPGAIKRFN